MKKRYEVPNMMEWHPVFKAGRTRLQVSFTGGHLCGGACTPAFFVTSDPVVQTIIEKSTAFRSGRIRLNKDSQVSVPEQEKKPAAIFEYSSEEDIYDYLEKTHGLPVEQLCEEGACFREAKRLGITLRKV